MENNEENEQELLRQLDEMIVAELQFCNGVATPYVCRLNTPENQHKLMEMIRKRVIHEDMEIGEAILSIERELNPNIPD